MSNPNSQTLDSSNEMARRVRNAAWISVLFLGGSMFATVMVAYVAFQNPVWQLFALAGGAAAMGGAAGVSLWLNRHAHSDRGVKLLIGAILVLMQVVPFLIAGVGLVVGLLGLLITLAVATQTLSQKDVNQVLIISIAVAAVASLVEVLGLGSLDVTPGLQTIFLVGAGIVTLLYAIFIVLLFDSLTLHTKLIITFLAVALIPLTLVVFLNNRSTRRALTDAANQTLLAAASETAANIDSFIDTNLKTIEAEAQLPQLVGFLSTPVGQRSDSSTMRDILRSLSLKNEHILTYGLLNDQGHNVADSNQFLLTTDESHNEYFKVPFQTNLAYVSPVLMEETGRSVIYFSAPIRNILGQVTGVLRVTYEARILQDLVRQGTGATGEKSFAILLDENHIRLVDDAQPGLEFKSVVPLDSGRMTALKAAGRLPDLPPEELSTTLSDFEQGLNNTTPDQPHFTGRAHPGAELEQGGVIGLKTLPWLVVFVQAQSAFLSPIERQTRDMLLFAIGIGAIVTIAAVVVSQRLAKPIVNLTLVAEQLAAGNLDVQVPIETRDEAGQLAKVFNSMTVQLRALIGSLESQVQARTADLLLSLKIGQRAAAIRELDQLLPTITEFIRQQFNLYYTQVYLIDDAGENLVLKAGTGTVGQQLLARRYILPVGDDSVAGRVAVEKRAIVVADTQESAFHDPHFLLPHTRSELAVPLIVEDQVIGVLDMQSDHVNTFTTQNLTVFEAMATQLALSIDGARQWASAQEAQRKMQGLIKQLTHQAWTETLAKQKTGLGFAYDLASVTPLEANMPNGGISVPVVVQSTRVGQIAVETPANKLLSQEERELLTAVAQQLAQKVENLRLFEETQRQAAREQIARQITDKVRTSRNIEAALKTAAEELNKALGTARAVIDLRVEPQPTNSHPEEAKSLVNSMEEDT